MIPFRRSCREVTRIVLEGEERSLSLGERTVLRLHWMACEGCSRFRGQLGLMRGALAQRRESDEGKR